MGGRLRKSESQPSGFLVTDGSSSAQAVDPATSRFKWLDNTAQWNRLAEILRHTVGPVAVDTEYLIGDDETCAYRSKLHVWSIGWAPVDAPRNARGVRPAIAVVLPWVAANYTPMVRALEAHKSLWSHNAPVDRHTIDNLHQTNCTGWYDSLSLARWVMPERAPPFGRGYSLDALGEDLLGYGKTEDFKDLVSYDNVVDKVTKTKACACVANPCLKRGALHPREITETVTKVVRGQVRRPLDEIVPGHPRWARLLAYSARDALIGCEVTQLLLARLKPRVVPW
jgi:hypothetical protein